MPQRFENNSGYEESGYPPGMLEPGDGAPAFSLLDQHGQLVSLTDFAGRKLLVYFYPEADTPGCTVQSCAVRDARDELAALGLDVVGISPDQPDKQLRFDQKFDLGFPLLSDPDRAVAEAYGVRGTKWVTRSSFLIDEDGRIQEAWAKVSPKETVPKARKALRGG